MKTSQLNPDHARRGERAKAAYRRTAKCLQVLQDEEHFSGGVRRLVCQARRQRNEAIYHNRLALTERRAA